MWSVAQFKCKIHTFTCHRIGQPKIMEQFLWTTMNDSNNQSHKVNLMATNNVSTKSLRSLSFACNDVQSHWRITTHTLHHCAVLSVCFNLIQFLIQACFRMRTPARQQSNRLNKFWNSKKLCGTICVSVYCVLILIFTGKRKMHLFNVQQRTQKKRRTSKREKYSLV